MEILVDGDYVLSEAFAQKFLEPAIYRC